MTRLFNGILRTGHFPKNWEMGRVIAVPKAGKGPRLATSQRPITLLSHIDKLFERIALRRLLRHLTPRAVWVLQRALHYALAGKSLPPHGRRAQPGSSYRRSLSRYREGVRPSVAPRAGVQTTKNANPAYARADSSVVPGMSQFLRCSRGRDLGSTTHPRRSRLQDWEEDVVLALYGDDSAYFASSRRADLATAKIQSVLDLLPEWLDKWRVAVSVTKTAGLLTGQQRTMPPKPRLRRQDVEWQTKVRYLGVQIDRTMRMAAQVERGGSEQSGSEPRGTCCAQCFDRTCRSEPNSPYTRATSVPG
ncbi:RNA-directed DNA polymerase from mobile element jockey [Eumeta japonica]|uniref:RNA-directed DNA polymerase from mobile element jockey n=1 Tax=Eumeta variegata TaxID=151549 RepID=A0A4C1UQM9_EUMVA|nr:RNA-directed DNA polymerase from mobile element jockey [Eumeta japonica]